jgi:LemA protein
MKKGLLMGVGVIGGLVLLVGFSLVGTRNRLVNADENVTSAWSQVENVLQRRSDLIPNLVATVKGYAKQETQIFTNIANARAQMAGARTIPEKIQANQQLEGALARLLVVVERYPDLKSNQNFQALQDELSGTENRIAVERMRYNDAVKTYNVMVRQFPNNIAAGLFGYEKKDAYFQADEAAKTVPKVKF